MKYVLDGKEARFIHNTVRAEERILSTGVVGLALPVLTE